MDGEGTNMDSRVEKFWINFLYCSDIKLGDL